MVIQFVEPIKNIAVTIPQRIQFKNQFDYFCLFWYNFKLSFRVNEYERAEFEIKAVPAGAQALVMEITARQYSADDKYTLINDGESSFAAYCDASMNDDKIQITTDGGNITVKNISDSPISEMSIYYKYLIDGIYYGGIAFSGKFQDIQPGESVTQTSERFSKNGVIVNTRIA